MPLDNLGIVEEAVENLPDKDDWHENKVDTAENKDVCSQTLGQFLPENRGILMELMGKDVVGALNACYRVPTPTILST